MKESLLELMTHRFEVRELFAGSPRGVIAVQLHKLLVDNGDRFECFKRFAAIRRLPMRLRRRYGTRRMEQRRKGTERAFFFKPGDVVEQFAPFDDPASHASFCAFELSRPKVGHRGAGRRGHATEFLGCVDELFRRFRMYLRVTDLIGEVA